MDFAALQHSVFLQALGSSILNSLWQCFILWLIYETISISYKAASAKFKNNLSTLLLFCCFAWFLSGFVSEILNQKTADAIPVIENIVASSSIVDDASGLRTFIDYAAATLPYLSVAYILLLCFLMLRLFAAYRYVYSISKKKLHHATDRLHTFAAKVALQIGITKKICVWISNHIDVPSTIGFIKPVILIPLASINSLSCQQLEAIILHELAHIKRNDYITNLLISVIDTILFFNPFVVLLSNVIKRERENCCDDFVLQYRYDPHSYASALLCLEQSRTSKLKLAVGAVSDKKQLLSRIKRITNNHVKKQFNYGQKLVVLFLVTLCICTIAWLSPGQRQSMGSKASVRETKSFNLSDIIPAPGKISNTEASEPLVNSKRPENLQPTGNKHPLPKNLSVATDENTFENFPPENLNIDQNENNPVFLAEGETAYHEAHNLKQPDFYFDESNFKLPANIKIQDFPFENMNFFIDLSKIDVAKLNENLREAYNQINAVDWEKVQGKIRKSFPKMKIKNFPKILPDAFYKSQGQPRLNILDGKQLDPKIYLEKLNLELAKQDSLRSSQLALLDESNVRIQREYQKLARVYNKNTSTNYYYNYTNSQPNAGSEQANATYQQKNTPGIGGKRNVRIAIRTSPNHKEEIKEKMHLDFSFSSDRNEKSGDHVITIGVNEMP